MSDWNAGVIDEFRKNKGKVGGYFKDATIVLLHTKGAKTKKERVNPVVTMKDGDRYLIFASKGGADTHPDWYHNIVAHPDFEIEVGEHKLKVHASEIKGAERDKLYALQAKRAPSFAEYEKKTKRKIPVIALTPQ